jgi:exopolyphosphatase/guanosine-5'-triphosphate,3'-diphosphate pyrophosphatase
VPVPGERELLVAAARLHGGRDSNPLHAREAVLAAELYGHTPREVALLAQIARYERKGTPALDELAPLCEPGDEALVARCALLLRLAGGLVPAGDRSVRRAELVPARGGLRLALDGDDRLARWIVARQPGLDGFRRVCGRPLRLD